MLNLATGLLKPQKGKVMVDDEDIYELDKIRSWQSQISYISQKSFIFDGPIIANICVGIEQPDENELVYHAMKIAKLDEFIWAKERDIWFNVGENGCKLSAGQRQRLLIARAVYNRKDILILDEATSMLDKKTEAAVIINLQSIYNTIIIVSHDPSVAKFCQRVVKL